MAQRWARLKRDVRVVGPSGRRPTVLMFHGCGGIWRQPEDYAAAVASLGVRTVVVDSYAPRGWSRSFGATFVCTGALLRGPERAGDVLASVYGAVHDLDADPERLLLAGWSHGAWSIMDLMTMPLRRPGEAELADAAPEPLRGVRALYLAYPYGGVGALSRTRAWVRTPRTYGVIALKDHITSVPDSERLFQTPRRAGAELEVWRAPARHGFDEPDTPLSVLNHQEALAHEALERFSAYVRETIAESA
jgi:dienelactone hydrolase